MHTTLVTTVVRRRQTRRPPRSTAVCAILAALALVVSIAPSAAATPSSGVPADSAGAVAPAATQEQSDTDGQADGSGESGDPGQVECELEATVTEHCPVWVHGSGFNLAAMAQSPDGELVFHATTPNKKDEDTFELVALRPDSGSTVWSVRAELPSGIPPWSGPAGMRVEPWNAAVSPDGSRIYVVGRLRTFTGSTAWTVAFDTGTGEQLWATTASEMPVGQVGADRWLSTQAVAVAVSPDGQHVYVGGSGGPSANVTSGEEAVWYNQSPEVVALDADTGDVEWRHRPADPQNPRLGYSGVVADLAVAPDGSRVYASVKWHGTWDPQNLRFSNVLVVAYDTSTGSPEWRFTPPLPPRPTALDPIFGEDGGGVNAGEVSLSPDGRRLIYHTFTWGFTNTDRLFALDPATGQVQWMRSRVDSVGCTEGNANFGDHTSAMSPDGRRVYWAVPACNGTAKYGAFNGRGVNSVAVVAFDAATGKTVWVAEPTLADDSWSDPVALAVNPDGSEIYVAGWGGTSDAARPITMAFGAFGHQLWQTHNDWDAGALRAVGLSVGPDGHHLYTQTMNSVVQDFKVTAFDLRTAGLSVAGVASPEQVAVGEPLRLSFSVANAGPAAAEDTTLTVRLDERFVAFATEESGSCTHEFGVVTCELGVGSGETATVQIVVTPKAAGSAVTSTSVRAPQFDPALDDNRVVIETQIGAA